MITQRLGWLAVACALLGTSCAKSGTAARPSAIAVCVQLQNLALVTNCEPERPGEVSASARDKVKFSVENYFPGQVLTFATAADYDRTVAAFSASAGFAASHRFGNAQRLVFIQLNEKVSAAFSARIRQVIERP